MELYLRPINDATQFSDHADYPSDLPFTAPAGMEWMPGAPPLGARAYEKPTINEILERAFLAVLPAHLGQPYLADATVMAIMSAKQGITDANKIDPSGALAARAIRGLALPPEMDADRAALLALIPVL